MTIQKSLFDVHSASSLLTDLGVSNVVIFDSLKKHGITSSEVREILDFTVERTEDLEGSSDAIVDIIDIAVDTVAKGFVELKKYMDMAKGYQEMGELNLSISKESHHLENEVRGRDEMGQAESKKRA